MYIQLSKPSHRPVQTLPHVGSPSVAGLQAPEEALSLAHAQTMLPGGRASCDYANAS